MGDEAVGVAQDLAWLAAQFAALDALEEERRAHIRTFAQRLEHVEAERVRVLGARMEELTRALVNISYELEPAIDRLVERIAVELNVVALSNRRDHADVLARLERTAVAARQRMLQRAWGHGS